MGFSISELGLRFPELFSGFDNWFLSVDNMGCVDCRDGLPVVGFYVTPEMYSFFWVLSFLAHGQIGFHNAHFIVFLRNFNEMER